MIYPVNLFSDVSKTPYFYTNFVSTIDGKVQARGKGRKNYGPIGSKLDFETLLWLRAHADVLVHGRNTAAEFPTLKTLAKKEFKGKRKKLGKKEDLLYMILSNHPEEKLLSALKNPPPGVKPLVVNGNDLTLLAEYFRENKLHKILVEGGPALLASFLKAGLIDEIFLTMAPKIFGGSDKTKTMVEGYLFPPAKIPRFKLLSVINKKSELYLRYKKIIPAK